MGNANEKYEAVEAAAEPEESTAGEFPEHIVQIQQPPVKLCGGFDIVDDAIVICNDAAVSNARYCEKHKCIRTDNGCCIVMPGENMCFRHSSVEKRTAFADNPHLYLYTTTQCMYTNCKLTTRANRIAIVCKDHKCRNDSCNDSIECKLHMCNRCKKRESYIINDKHAKYCAECIRYGCDLSRD